MGDRLTAWLRGPWLHAALAAILPLPAIAQPAPVVSPEGAYHVDQGWPQRLPNQWLIGDVGGVTVDRHDHVWIVHRPASLTAADVQAGSNPRKAKGCAAARPPHRTSLTFLRWTIGKATSRDTGRPSTMSGRGGWARTTR